MNQNTTKLLLTDEGLFLLVIPTINLQVLFDGTNEENTCMKKASYDEDTILHMQTVPQFDNEILTIADNARRNDGDFTDNEKDLIFALIVEKVEDIDQNSK